MGTPLKKDGVIIPPYWVDLAASFIFLGIAFWCWNVTEYMSYRMAARIRMIGGVGTLLLIKTLFHYSIHEKGIYIRFIWIPVWLIRWERISSAEYIYKWYTGAKWGKMDGQGIFVTLNGCPYFSPEIDPLNMFELRYVFRCFFIRFTPKRQRSYVEIFKQYYPTLDFQIGYEDNLNKK